MSTSSHTNSDYFPWTWTITSLDKTTHTCPPVSSLLGTFAAVNCIVSLLAVIFGHRIVVQRLTCGFFGERGSRSWIYMWVFPVGLQLAANAFVALLIKRSVGYKADFKISEMMLFLVARPRLSWIVLGMFAFKSQKIGREKEKARRREKERQLLTPDLGMASYPSTPQSYGNAYSPWVSQDGFANPTPYSSQTALYPPSHARGYQQIPRDDRGAFAADTDRDFPWWSAFMTQFIAEFVLQIMSLYIMGRTAHFATAHGYYMIHRPSYWAIPSAARMMYSGALYYLVAGSLFLIFTFMYILFKVITSKEKTWEGYRTSQSPASASMLIVLLVSTWMGSWIFWAGFVKLAGDLYCPPKLIHQGVIWTFFSGIGILLGTGV